MKLFTKVVKIFISLLVSPSLIVDFFFQVKNKAFVIIG